jgi:GNAT superfamily N-acetyltransferase
MAITIRNAIREDISQIYAFIHELAEYENMPPDTVCVTEANLERDGFGESPYFRCLIAEHNDRPAGFALYYFNYSTFSGKPGLYIEDLFVVPELRRNGIGKALLARVAANAVKLGSRRLQWEVLDWNLPSMEFYQSLGAEFVDEWRNMRITDGAVEKLAMTDRAGSTR